MTRPVPIPHSAPVSAGERMFFAGPSRIVLACGARHELPALLARQHWKHALVVTDRWFTGSSPVVRELVAGLAAQGVAASVFDGGAPDPSVALCDAATRALRSDPAHAGIDHLIAVGGGSNLDLAKVLALTLRDGRPAESFVGSTAFAVRPLPLVAVPTTAGTGSEITPGAILTKAGSATKVAVMGNALRPAIAVIDPELTVTCPPRVTADAGIDALTHAIESYVTCDATAFDTGGDPDPGYSGRNRLTTLLAREAIALVFAHLGTAHREPGDLAARTGMAWASLYAALSYASAGLHAVHGLAYALAGLTHASHGSTNAAFPPYVMTELVATRPAELAEIARLAGARGEDDETLAWQAPARVRGLVESVGIPVTLGAFGVRAADLDRLVADGLAVTRLARAFPLAHGDTLPAAYRRIVDHAFSGTLPVPMPA